MNTCEGNKNFDHAEIVHNDKNCPFCYYMNSIEEKIEELQFKLETALKDIEKLEEENHE